MSDRQPAPQLTHRQILVVLSGLMMGMFLAALDQTIVATAIRVIADDLHGLSQQAWATTAYLITSTASTPLYGKLSDIYGRKPFYLAAISIFVVGSLTCTFATSMYELAMFRAMQGLGAGGLMSLALTIIADMVSPRDRPKFQGYFLAVFGTATVLGPVVGGFFAGHAELLGVAGWRWVFLVNVPLGVIALVVVSRVLRVSHRRRDHRIDYWGAAALAVAVVPLLLVAEQGRQWGWGNPPAIACYLLATLGTVAFLLIERAMGDEALLPLRLFRTPTFRLALVATSIVGMGMFGGTVLIPQYLQIVRGDTPTEAGLAMLPMMAGMMCASILSGQVITRTGRYKVFPIIGTALAATGMLLFTTVGVDTPIAVTMAFMVVLGLGLGNCMQTLTITIQNAVPPGDIGAATASATFFRQLGGTLGVAVFLSLLFSTVTGNISAAFARAHLDPRPGRIELVLSDSSFLQRIDPRLARPFQEGFTDSMHAVFFSGAGVLVLAFVVTLFIQEIPLRMQSADQAAAMESETLP